MELVKMKALAVGTVVGSVVNAAGEVNSGCIVHVDPDNKSEKGRYTNPLCTEETARKLEQGGYAERVGTVKLENGFLVSGVDAEVAAERVGEAAAADADGPGSGVSALDTKQSINFADRENVSGDVPGVREVADDADAPPADTQGSQQAGTQQQQPPKQQRQARGTKQPTPKQQRQARGTKQPTPNSTAPSTASTGTAPLTAPNGGNDGAGDGAPAQGEKPNGSVGEAGNTKQTGDAD